MSCHEAERLFISDAPESLRSQHMASCPACAAAERDYEEIGRRAAELRPPAWTASLRETLLAIPAQTVSCEMADQLAAGALESEERLHPADRQRFAFHLSRCEACAEAAKTLRGMRELVSPEPLPWFAGRMAATARRPRPAQRAWRWLLDPKAAIALAYAAAIALLLLGFNPADLARRARTDLPQDAKTVVADAQSTAADRIGAFTERAIRTALVVKSRVFGYGRAALTNAVQLVMKSEPPPSRGRTRNGSERGANPKNETEIMVCRA